MKKIVCLILGVFLSLSAMSAEDSMTKTFLDNFFCMESYELDSHHYSDFDFYCARNTIDVSDTFFTKAIVFRIKDNTIEPLAYFLDNRIFNKNKLLFEGIIKSQKFYGWKIKFTDKNKSFSTTFFTNDSKNVTEGPIFMWKNNEFARYVIDTSDY